MSYHLRLKKALSFCGIITATKKAPDVYVEDKATADKAVATGYFKLVEDETEEKLTGNLDKAQLEEMKVDDLKQLAIDMGIDVTGIRKKADFIDAITAEEVKIGEETNEDDNEVDYGEGSPTMVELQEK